MNTEQIIRLVAAARGLEAGGFYNTAKILWGLAYSEEIKASNQHGLPRRETLVEELGAIMDMLRAEGVDSAVISALEKGQTAVMEERTVPYSDTPDVYVSRTSGEVFLGVPPQLTANGDHRLGLREFRAIWYFEFLSPRDVLAALENNPSVIEAGLADLSAEQMLIPSEPGEWNMRELLNHLLLAQELLAGRVDNMLAQDNPPLEGLAIWGEVAEEMLSAGEILERYRASREALVERLKSLDSAGWHRSGQHSEFGPQTVLTQATYFARHELSHLPQLYAIRRAAGG